MGKNPRKPAAPRKPKHTLLPLSSPILANLAKTRLIKKTPSHSLPIIHPDQLGALVDDEVLTCSICLQLFMSPVLAECGHPFCLVCAEDLATYGFACGICHSHQPTYDQPGSMVI